MVFAFKNSPSDHGIYGGQKIESAQKINASRGWWEMHAHQFW